MTGDTRQLLLLLQLLSFNIKNTARNRKKRILLRKKQVQFEKKHDYENKLGKAEFYALYQKQNVGCCRLPLFHDENTCLSSQQKNGRKDPSWPRNSVNKFCSKVKTVKFASTFANYVSTNQSTWTI